MSRYSYCYQNKLTLGMILTFMSVAAILIGLNFLQPVYADTVNAWGNIDDSNGTANLLIDLMQNDPEYDPFYEFNVIRSGEREYRLYMSKDLASSDHIVRYIYIPAYMNQNAQISRSVVDSYDLHSDGFTYVGNTKGALASQQATSYVAYKVVTIVAIALFMLFIFKLLRRSSGRQKGYYNIKN